MNDIYLTDMITILSTQYDEWGTLTTPIATDMKARVVFKNQIVHNKDGKEVVSEMKVFIKPEAIIKYEDKIKIDLISGVRPQIWQKEFIIKKLDHPHGFANFSIEVYL